MLQNETEGKTQHDKCFQTRHKEKKIIFALCFPPLSLQEQALSRTLALSQVQVQEGQSLKSVKSVFKQDAGPKLPSDQPRILYQCGDCDELFKSLDLWQQHRKEGSCQNTASGSKLKPDSLPEAEACSAQSPSALNPDDASLSTGTISDDKPDHVEEPVVEKEERQQDAEAFSAQSPEPPVSEVAPATPNPEDPSPKKRGANKKPKPEPVLLCVDCGSCFGLVPELVAHRKTQHGFGEALHRCSVCGESFLNTTLFLYHRKQHRQKGEEKVVVVPEATVEEVCTQSNGTDEQEQDGASGSTNVASNFTQPELFMCIQCGQSFNDEEGLVTHRKQKHGLKEPLHSCSHCGETFMNTTQYLYHWREHRFSAGVEAMDEPQDAPKSSKRLLSPASASESDLQLSKRSRPSIRILSGKWRFKAPLRQDAMCLISICVAIRKQSFRYQRGIRGRCRNRLRVHQPSSTCQAAAGLVPYIITPCLPLLWQNLHPTCLPAHPCLQPHGGKALHVQGDNQNMSFLESVG